MLSFHYCCSAKIRVREILYTKPYNIIFFSAPVVGGKSLGLPDPLPHGPYKIVCSRVYDHVNHTTARTYTSIVIISLCTSLYVRIMFLQSIKKPSVSQRAVGVHCITLCTRERSTYYLLKCALRAFQNSIFLRRVVV